MIFALIAILVWVCAHGYVGWSLARPMLAGRAKRWVWAALVVNASVTVAALALRRSVPGAPMVDALQWVGYVGMGLFALVLVLAVLRDLVSAAGWAVRRWVPARPNRPAQSADTPADPSRRALFGNAVNAGLMGTAVVGSAWGGYQARKLAQVVDVDVPIAGLADGLDGFEIAQISDVHVGPTIKRPYMEAVVERVNGLKSDLIAFTGDMIDGYVDELGPEVAPIERLAAPHGVYFVTGNHEYYWDAPAWCAEIARCGLGVLNNTHRLVEVDGARLLVGGVTDYRAGRHDPGQASDPAGALAGAPPADLRLLLAHQPKSVSAAAAAGWDLQLSGHTHGGQFWPWNLLVGLAHPFTQGLHTYEDMQIYVSRGTGYWGPPLRLGVPSEITRLTLRKVEAAEGA